MRQKLLTRFQASLTNQSPEIQSCVIVEIEEVYVGSGKSI